MQSSLRSADDPYNLTVLVSLCMQRGDSLFPKYFHFWVNEMEFEMSTFVKNGNASLNMD